ncbi:single-stranded-DNA-specific exonuclease RecJ [Candidatus Saccharibacteria bacterium]|nr:single-stranded-DNA-specific exonuclease RecJ [Candidatus Saccharibacteria bacterium]
MNKLFTQLLEKRQITDAFLHPKYENLTPTSKMPDMDKAIARIKQAISSQEKILIYGDYDVDGITASAVMETALRLAGANPPEIMLPDRFIDGYGMSPRLIERAKKDGITLVITVDCGSRNHDIVSSLNLAHIDTIITDHHECEDTLPDAIAIINPHRHDYDGPDTLKHLAGVGVAFKLAKALEEERLIPSGQEKWLLDLVLIGTICDSMLTTGENHILGHYGIKVLEKTRRKGLKELMKNAGVTKITSESIGFQIGPRLNSSGRLESAELSLELLRTDSAARAAAIAMKLEDLNRKRRLAQRTAVSEIIKRRTEPRTDDSPVIIEAGHWHEGIIGIVAGRLVENYHKPAFVLTEVEDGIYKGSGRSFGDFNLAEALSYAKDTIEGGGGHAAAAGVRVRRDHLPDFCDKINEYYHSLHLTDQEKYFQIKADLATTDLTDFTLDLLSDLKFLEPYGAGNDEPIFRITGAHIHEARAMGSEGQHLRLDIADKSGKILKCIAFSAPKEWFNLDETENYDFLIRPTENEFRGTRSVEAYLLAVSPAGTC